MAEQLMRVQVGAAVIAVAVVEVAVDHQDLGLLEVLEGFLSKLGAFVHFLYRSAEAFALRKTG
jgi:hypothetical protein